MDDSMLEDPAVALPLPGRHPDEECADLIEISTSGIWTASSSLPNHGIDNINDRDLETYWQYGKNDTLFLVHRASL